MSYTMYTPLNVWLDPASVTDVVAYIQTYLSENTIYSETEIEAIIHDYLLAHPELIGGVQSVNGKTGVVVLSASDINTEDDVTIESVLASLSSQISSIASSVATNTSNITNLTGRVTTAETDISNLKSNINKAVNVDTSSLIIGRANADGTFSPNLSSVKYILRPCVGMKNIVYVAQYWGTPGGIFYDNNLNVVSTFPNKTSTTPTTIDVPSDASYYSINVAADVLTTFSVIENYYDVAESLDDKIASVIEQNVDIDSEKSIGLVLATGEITSQSAYIHVLRDCRATNLIKIKSAFWSTPRLVFFAADGSVLSTTAWGNGENTYFAAVPENATKYAVNCTNESPYVSNFAITEYVDTKSQIVLNNSRIIDLQPKYADLVLPSFIPAVVGKPTYLYWENVISNGFLKQYFIQPDGVFGAYPDERISVPSSAGNTTIPVNMYDGYKIIKSGSFALKAVAANVSGSPKCLIIGDSKSEVATPWNTLDTYLNSDASFTPTFLGTNTIGPIKTEAYSGKSIVNVCDDEYITGTTPNIFYDASVTTANGHHFSFAKAVSTLGATPDIVFIDHGANQYATQWKTIKGCYDDVIASIHSVNSNIKIVVVIQEGQGILRTKNVPSNGKWWLENPGRCNASKMLKEYRDRDAEKIYIQPTYVCVDLYRDYPLCSIPTFDGAAGEMEILMDATHPGLNTNPWNASTAYSWGDWVAKNDKGYGCKKANTNIDPETDDGTYWAECKNLGDGYRKKGLMYYCMLKYLMTV